MEIRYTMESNALFLFVDIEKSIKMYILIQQEQAKFLIKQIEMSTQNV